MEVINHNFTLDDFKASYRGMISTSDNEYTGWDGRKIRNPLRQYTSEEIENIICSGSVEELQKLSYNYFDKDGFYRRIILYYATLLKYVGILIPYPKFGQDLSKQHILKRYYNALDYIENMRLPQFLTNCAIRVFRDGSYYGIINKMDKEGFSVIDLPAKYCTSRYKDIEGNDILELNLDYFTSIRNEEKRKLVLKSYPKEIQKAYKEYSKKGDTTKKWYLVPTDLAICIPFLDGAPAFLNVISAVMKYEQAVDIELDRYFDEVKKIVVQTIPHLNDGTLLFEPPEAEVIHEGTVKMLRNEKNLSVLTSYADVDIKNSKTSSSDSKDNGLVNMKNNIFNEAGVSGQLFSSEGSNTLAASVQNDIAFVMILGNKFSGFITNVINKVFANSNISFKYSLLPVSSQNESDYIDTAFKLASSGYSLLIPSIAMGISQKDLDGLKTLENDVLKLTEKLIPLQTAYTQSSSEGGRPAMDDSKKSDVTLQKDVSLDKNDE